MVCQAARSLQAFLLQVAVYAVLTEEPRRRFSIADPFAAESSSLKTSIVMELCDRGSLLHMREKIWAMMKQVGSPFHADVSSLWSSSR